MKRYALLAAALAATMIAAPASAALPVGAAAPDFSTQGAMGGKAFQFSLRQALRKGPRRPVFLPCRLYARVHDREQGFR